METLPTAHSTGIGRRYEPTCCAHSFLVREETLRSHRIAGTRTPKGLLVLRKQKRVERIFLYLSRKLRLVCRQRGCLGQIPQHLQRDLGLLDECYYNRKRRISTIATSGTDRLEQKLIPSSALMPEKPSAVLNISVELQSLPPLSNEKPSIYWPSPPLGYIP